MRYGMSEALGNVTYDRDRSPFLQPNVPAPQERNYSEETAEAVDRAVRQLVDARVPEGHGILQQNRALLDRTAAALLETETLGASRRSSAQRRDRSPPRCCRPNSQPQRRHPVDLRQKTGWGAYSNYPPSPEHLTELPTIRRAPHGDRIGGLAVNRIIADRQLRLIHAQRHEDRDHLENDKRGDGVVDDDERRALELQQKLVFPCRRRASR